MPNSSKSSDSLKVGMLSLAQSMRDKEKLKFEILVRPIIGADIQHFDAYRHRPFFLKSDGR